MSTYFSDASSSTEGRHRNPQVGQYQSNLLLKLFEKLLRCAERRRQSTAFRDLADDPHLLKDIGLTKEEVMHVASKPFWR